MERSIRGFHQGQRHRPHQQAGHMTAPDRSMSMLGVTSRNLSKSSADAALPRSGVSVGLTPEAGWPALPARPASASCNPAAPGPPRCCGPPGAARLCGVPFRSIFAAHPTPGFRCGKVRRVRQKVTCKGRPHIRCDPADAARLCRRACRFAPAAHPPFRRRLRRFEEE
jgi:hypothetical protein